MNRTIDLEGCLNFRDLGGYPTADGRAVRWRQVFRSDALHHLTRQDVAHLREEIRLGTVIDLRSTAELRSEGRGPLAHEAVAFHHLPLFDGQSVKSAPSEMTLTDRYFLLAQFAQEPIGRVVTALAASDAPAVYHCAAGKDRTGVVSAVLLGLLGVPDAVIVADYAATKENLDAIVERLMATKGYYEMLSALPPDTMHAEPETMAGLLTRLREAYGSMRDYARAAGVSDEALDGLRARLLE
ncbi:tyrosine-protein phosphatase [bacterium]|nr:tyrosine-protein phosphatase [bacterium]